MFFGSPTGAGFKGRFFCGKRDNEFKNVFMAGNNIACNFENSIVLSPFFVD